ncbi:MAG: MFS transporter [Candidatus Bathyarchaeia archaeon]
MPDYLRFLGVSAVVVGLVGGLGEFLGYAARLVSGMLVDATRAYWGFILVGYGLIAAIPIIGFTGRWELALILVLVERLGKAIRSPARDAVLSMISRGVGAGKAFGIHEFLDQVGAVLGPIIVAIWMLYSGNDYKFTFAFLLIPFLTLTATLLYTYRKIGSQTTFEPTRGNDVNVDVSEDSVRGLKRPFYTYTCAVTLNTVGIIPAALILYKASVILQPENQQWMVPLIYSIIQGVDASAALLSGYVYDRVGVKVLVAPFILSTLPPLFTIVASNIPALLAASMLFGVVLGMQESVYRAAVSHFTSTSSRGMGYGVFNTAYGLGLLVSGAVYGLLMDLKTPFIVTLLFITLTQIAATTILLGTKGVKVASHQDGKELSSSR